jgi:hypothetical protein
VPAQAHEIVPAYNGSVGGYLLYLSALGEHVSGLNRPGQLVLDAGDDYIHYAGVGAYALELAVELIEGDGGHAVGFVEVKFYLLFGGEGMYHVGHGSDEVHGIEHEYGLGAVGHGDGDLVVRPHADGAQRFGAFAYLLHQPAVGGGPAHEVEGHVIRVLLRNLLHRFKHRALKILKMRRDLAYIIQPRSFDLNFLHYQQSTFSQSRPSSSCGFSRSFFRSRTVFA